ncbi:MAG: WhiB family transcriptional regulator [Saccharothrix sp.]|nr:WhiB family transcriptional regulator [Saccharothrix sp.]
MNTTDEDASAYGYRALMLALFGTTGRPPAWREQAACRGLDTERFFATSAKATSDAVAVCSACPVRDLCREDQLAWESTGPRSRRYRPAGVAGGLSGSQRRNHHYPTPTDRTGLEVA